MGLNIHFPSDKQRRADKRYFEDQYSEFVLQFPSDDEDLEFEKSDLEVIEVDDKKSTGHVTLAKDPLDLVTTHLHCYSGVELKVAVDGGGGTLNVWHLYLMSITLIMLTAGHHVSWFWPKYPRAKVYHGERLLH